MEKIPHDIVLAILLRLPASVLLKLRWACKSWLSSTTGDPWFIAKQIEQSTLSSPPLLVIRDKKVGDLCFLEYRSGTHTHKRLMIDEVTSGRSCLNLIIPTANGLLMLYCEKKLLHVLNPCTRQMATLPKLEPEPDGLMTLPFLFGIDPSTGKYKAIRLMTDIHSYEGCYCDVFTQGTLAWRRLSGRSPPFYITERYPVCVKGVLYCLTGIRYEHLIGGILSFDLAQEKLAQFLSPPDHHNIGSWHEFDRGARTLQVLEGRLSVVDIISISMQIEIWMLEEAEEPMATNDMHKWYKLYSFQVDIPVPVRGRHMGRVIVTPEGDFLIWKFGNIYSFDPKRKIPLLKLREYDANSMIRISYTRCSLYTETLAPVD